MERCLLDSAGLRSHRLPHQGRFRPALRARVGSNLLFQLTRFVPQVAGFRRSPVQIKDLRKAIWSCSEGWWNPSTGQERKRYGGERDTARERGGREREREEGERERGRWRKNDRDREGKREEEKDKEGERQRADAACAPSNLAETLEVRFLSWMIHSVR